MRQPVWTRDPMLRGLGALMVLVAAWLGTGRGAGPVLVVSSWLVILGLQIGQTVLAVGIARRPGLSRSTRRFWWLLAAAPAAFTVSSVAQVVTALTSPTVVAAVVGSPVRIGFIATGALALVLALLTAPLGLSTTRERVRFWVDACTVMIGVAAAVWLFGPLQSSVAAGDHLHVEDLLSALIGPAAMLVVVFGVVKLLLSGAATFTGQAGAVGCLSCAIQAVGVTLTPQFLAAGRPAALLCLHILTAATFLATYRIQQLQMRPGTGTRPHRQRRPFSVLPYASIGTTYTLLIWALIDGGLNARAWIVLGCAIASTALVVARQIAAMADNAVLLRRLDAKVQELASTEEVLRAALEERNAFAVQLQHMAFHDSLTGLANRALFLERVDAALADTRHDGGRVDLLMIDLDGFKPINDEHGHAAGDTLLREVADRLVECVGSVGLVARLGGDEFAVVVESPTEPVDALVDRVQECVRRPVRVNGATVTVGLSVGVAVSDGGTADRATLMHHADLAMYASKSNASASR